MSLLKKEYRRSLSRLSLKQFARVLAAEPTEERFFKGDYWIVVDTPGEPTRALIFGARAWLGRKRCATTDIGDLSDLDDDQARAHIALVYPRISSSLVEYVLHTARLADPAGPTVPSAKPFCFFADAQE